MGDGIKANVTLEGKLGIGGELLPNPMSDLKKLELSPHLSLLEDTEPGQGTVYEAFINQDDKLDVYVVPGKQKDTARESLGKYELNFSLNPSWFQHVEATAFEKDLAPILRKNRPGAILSGDGEPAFRNADGLELKVGSRIAIENRTVEHGTIVGFKIAGFTDRQGQNTSFDLSPVPTVEKKYAVIHAIVKMDSTPLGCRAAEQEMSIESLQAEVNHPNGGIGEPPADNCIVLGGKAFCSRDRSEFLDLNFDGINNIFFPRNLESLKICGDCQPRPNHDNMMFTVQFKL